MKRWIPPPTAARTRRGGNRGSGLLSTFAYEGKTYAMPSNYSMWVCWYNRKQFRENGWEAPKTWGEFTALCEKVKKAGVAPLAFQGKYPYYAWATLLSLYQRLVPFEEWYELQDFSRARS